MLTKDLNVVEKVKIEYVFHRSDGSLHGNEQDKLSPRLGTGAVFLPLLTKIHRTVFNLAPSTESNVVKTG